MSNNDFELSIIITLYNRRELCLRALQSALEQTINKEINVEIVIVDDGSKDRPLEILESYIDKKYVKYFYKDNGGCASAKNFGVYNSKSRFVTFLDSDDYYNGDNALEELPSLMSKGYDLIAGTKTIVINSQGSEVQGFDVPNDIYESCLEYPLNYVGKPPFIFNREKFIDVGGLNEGHKWGDTISFWRKFTHKARIAYMESEAYVYDQSSDYSVGRPPRKELYKRALKTISESYEFNKAEIDLKGYAFNWGVIILALSGITFNWNLFSKWLLRCALSPVKTIKSILFVSRKRFEKR